MLLSELEERERRFKLAMRAGIPVLLLAGLVFYTLFSQHELKPTPYTVGILLAIVFVTVYFNYFLIDLSVKESLTDQTTQSFTQKAFITKLGSHQPKTLAILVVKNLHTINRFYRTEKVDHLLYTIIHNLDLHLSTYGCKNPLIARRYGAEFLIALKENKEDIEAILNAFMRNNRTIDDIEVDYTFAVVTDAQGDLEILLRDLHERVFEEVDTDIQKDRITRKASEVEADELRIKEALQHKRLQLSFRPLLNTKSQRVDIYELAVKLKDTQGELILPRTFLPVLNRLGLGQEYDLLLVEAIVKLLRLTDESISFTFNLSPFSLRTLSFQEAFFKLIRLHEVDPSRLIIQLYERKTHHNLSGYFETLRTFRHKGIRICIDNFGASNASMEYIKHFKFDMVQFDRDYVNKIDDTARYAMLRSLVTMAQSLGTLTVAKWVDNDKQKEKLESLGIDYLQGYGIGSILSEEALIAQHNPLR